MEFTEVVRPDETLAERDLTLLLKVLGHLSPADRERLPVPFLPPPEWAADRTLPIRELVAEDEARLERVWDARDAADRLPAGPDWDALLRGIGMSRAQFCGVLMAFGTASARSRVDARLDLALLAARGRREVGPLRSDDRTFVTLPADEQYHVTRRAAWLTIADRAARLNAVPEANTRLTSRHTDRLSAVLPRVFLSDPLAGLYPRREEIGLPFEEGSVSDRSLTWNPASAVIGTDAERR